MGEGLNFILMYSTEPYEPRRWHMVGRYHALSEVEGAKRVKTKDHLSKVRGPRSRAPEYKLYVEVNPAVEALIRNTISANMARGAASDRAK